MSMAWRPGTAVAAVDKNTPGRGAEAMKRRRDSPFGPLQTMWLRMQRPIKRAGVVGTILTGFALSLYAAAQMFVIRTGGPN